MEKSKVYFTKNITGDALIKMYEVLGVKLNGNVAVKLHSGEEGNQNYLRPEFVRPIIDYLCATVVECNTAYDGARNTTEKHKKLMDAHNWTKYFNVDIMDSEDDDLELEIENGKVIKENYYGNREPLDVEDMDGYRGRTTWNNIQNGKHFIKFRISNPYF